MSAAVPGRMLTMTVLLAVGLLAACETSFDPFTEGEGVFTVLGFLDTDADTQFVRVIPLREGVYRPDTPAPLDAQVMSTNLNTGAQVAWQDSLVQFSDSSYGHVYWAAFSAVPTHQYRLEVTRSDGKTTKADVQVPARPSHPDSVTTVPNESATYQPLFWPDVDEVIGVDVTYRVNNCPEELPQPPIEESKVVQVVYSQDDLGESHGGIWQLDLHLLVDREKVLERAMIIFERVTSRSELVLYEMKVRLSSPSEGWIPTDGIWDPEVLIQPGTRSNVDNGFGFWGAVARTTVDWELGPATMGYLGYCYYAPGYDDPSS